MAVVVLLFEDGRLDLADVGLLARGGLPPPLRVIASVRSGEVSVVAPFRYVGLLWAVVVGYLVWGHVPNSLAWTGIALLIVAGLYMIQQQRAPRPPAT